MITDTSPIEASLYRSKEALRAFHNALLPKTIENALQTRFFREKWADISNKTIERCELAELPLIDKADIRTAGLSAQNRENVICNDVFTTGTTGSPLITVRSNQEQKYISEFFTQLMQRRPNSKLLRGLEFTNPYHGHLVRIPSSIHYHRTSIYDAGSFEYGRSTILNQHKDANVDDHCSILVGIERCLRAFTLDTLKQYPNGFPPNKLHLLVTYSQYLTPSWRQLLQDVWGVPVVDRFGVSEVFGGATQSLECGWYHFEPFVIPEVIGAHSREVLSNGCGLLALTALYPFQQAQPLVRYLTGDLVEVTHDLSSRPGTTAIKPLGRACYGVPESNSDRWLITPASILEVVDSIPQVTRTPRFSDVAQVGDPYAVGNPKFRTKYVEEQSVVKVTLEVELSDDITGSYRIDILSKIEQAIVNKNILFKEALREGKASIQVLANQDIAEADLISQAHSGGIWSTT